MIRFLLLVCLVLIVGCSSENNESQDSTDLSSLLTAATTESNLIEQLGPENVRRDSFHVGEGFFEAATVVYPDDPTQRAYVLWLDEEFTVPDWVRVTDEESTWTIAGIGMGTSLRELEERNRRSFQLTGFGWDYGGTLIGWNGGHFETALPGLLISVRFGLSEEDYTHENVDDVLAADNFSSTNEVMQELNPTVVQLGIWFDQ